MADIWIDGDPFKKSCHIHCLLLHNFFPLSDTAGACLTTESPATPLARYLAKGASSKTRKSSAASIVSESLSSFFSLAKAASLAGYPDISPQYIVKDLIRPVAPWSVAFPLRRPSPRGG